MKKGVGSLDPGLGKASGAIEYTTMRARDAMIMLANYQIPTLLHIRIRQLGFGKRLISKDA